MANAIDRLIELDEQESMKQLERSAYLSLTDAVIEALPDALIVIDATGKIVLFNQKAEFMFGYNRSGNDRPSQWRQLMPECLRPGHIQDRETYNRFEISQRARTMGIGGNLLAIRRDGHRVSRRHHVGAYGLIKRDP